MPFDYFAFLSYSRKDEHFAARLQRDLERFRIPAAIERPRDLPVKTTHIRPIVRDRTDLDVSTRRFMHDLHDQLDRSRSLIVLCSPASANSTYVNAEIEHFLASRPGAQEFIVPIIVSGDPQAAPERGGCMPPALRALGPEFLERNHATFVQASREQVVLQTVARLLNLRYTVLYDRHVAARRRVQRVVTATALALAMVFAAISVYALFQRHHAMLQRAAAEGARQRAIVRLAQSQVATGDAQTALGQELEARNTLVSAIESFDQVGEDAINAEMSLTLNYARLPHSLCTIGPDDPVPAGLAISTSGKFIAAIDEAGMIRVRDAKTGALHATVQTTGTREVKAPNGKVVERAWLLRDSELAAVDQHAMVITLIRDEGLAAWSISTGKLLWKRLDVDQQYGLSVTPNGALLTCATDDELLRYRLPGFELVETMKLPETTWCAAASGDGHTALVGTGEGFLVADLFLSVYRQRQSANWVMGCSLSADGTSALTASYDRTLKLWNFADPARSRELAHLPFRTDQVALTPDGKLALAATSLDSITGWRLSKSDEQFKIPGDLLCISPDSSFAATRLDGVIKLWSLWADPRDFTDIVDDDLGELATLTPDGRLVIRSDYIEDKSLSRVFDAATGIALKDLHGPAEKAAALFPDSSGQAVIRITTSDESPSITVQIIDLVSGAARSQFAIDGYLPQLSGQAASYSASTDTLLLGLTRGSGNSVTHHLEAYQARTGARLFTIPVDRIFALALARNGSIAALATPKDVLLIDPASGRTLRPVEFPQARLLSSLALSHDGLVLAAGAPIPNSRLLSWDTSTGKPLKTVSVPRGDSVHLSAIGGKDSPFVTVGDNDVNCWDLNAGVLARSLPCSQRLLPGTTLTATDDGRKVLVGGSEPCVWDFSRARAYIERRESALQAMESLETRPDDATSLITLAEWYEFLGRTDWAASLLRGLPSESHPRVRALLARLRLQSAAARGSSDSLARQENTILWHELAAASQTGAERTHALLCAEYSPRVKVEPAAPATPERKLQPSIVYGDREAYQLELPAGWTPSVELSAGQIDRAFVRDGAQWFQVLILPLGGADANASMAAAQRVRENLLSNLGLSIDSVSQLESRTIDGREWKRTFVSTHHLDGSVLSMEFWYLTHNGRNFMIYSGLLGEGQAEVSTWLAENEAIIASFRPPPPVGNPRVVLGRNHPYLFAIDSAWVEMASQPPVDRTFVFDDYTYLYSVVDRLLTGLSEDAYLGKLREVLNKDITESPSVKSRYATVDARSLAGRRWAVMKGKLHISLLDVPLDVEEWILLEGKPFALKIVFRPGSIGEATARSALRQAVESYRPR